MATVSEIRKFIERSYSYEVVNDLYKILFEWDGGRSQIVFIEVNDTWFNALSPFASFEDLTPKQALQANAEYMLGMQAFADMYCIKYVVPIADLDESEVVVGLSYAAEIADLIEESLLGEDKF